MYVEVGVVVTVHPGVDEAQHVGVGGGEGGRGGDQGGGGGQVGLHVLHVLLLLVTVLHAGGSK